MIEKIKHMHLYNLTQDQLAHTLMPCGEYRKTK